MYEEDHTAAVKVRQGVCAQLAPKIRSAEQSNLRRVCIAHRDPTQAEEVGVHCTPYATVTTYRVALRMLMRPLLYPRTHGKLENGEEFI